MLTIHKKDKVVVISGEEKGKSGEVLKVFPEKRRVLVSKLNMITRHKKPVQGDPGGRVHMESPIALAKVRLLCPKCEKPMRPKFDKLQTGEKVRLCRRCGEVILAQK